MEITQSEQQKEKQILKHENILRDLWDNIKHTNIRITGVPEEEETEKRVKDVFDNILAENFPNLKKETDIQVQEEQKVPNKMKPNRPTLRHIKIKMAKVKGMERILKAAREKQRVTNKGTPIRLSANFSAETLQARREWHNTFKLLKGVNLQPRILYSARLSFRIERERKELHKQAKLGVHQY